MHGVPEFPKYFYLTFNIRNNSPVSESHFCAKQVIFITKYINVLIYKIKYVFIEGSHTK